ncbi:HD-GYP domain-containing protein [Brevibacillus dissolubilis]|uniref:HD-GYP domain-containing protein n=1 Tax=Brevibacillus dissolubilis TaxID=1844116 RepID=UPI0011170C4D|nr:HD-GYP domain-containing protein [Brevibacillus dissolubilis]
MRFISVTQAEPGMKMGQTVLTEDGKVLLGLGVVLDERLIQGLRKSGVDSIYIDDPHTEDIIVQDVIRPETRRKAVEAIQKAVKQITNSNKLTRRVSVKDMGLLFQKAFHEILEDLMENPNVMIHLISISSTSGMMYHHSVNVAVMATAVGMSLGYNRQQLTELGIGAMLHDVGKVLLPPEMFEKTHRWNPNEIETAKMHTRLGFDLLRKQHDLSLLTAHVAFQHHERLDGSGYPQGLSGSQIHEYAQIVGICDVYDSLTTPRPWRKRFMPQDALEYLLGTGDTKFSLRLVDAFRKHIAVFPLGTSIVMNTGEVGVVCRVDPSIAHRPVVRILKDGRGNDISMPYELDLRQDLKAFIAGFEDESLFTVSGFGK